MKIIIVTALIIFCLCGCAGGGRYWREEVALPDGRVILVSRWQKLGSPLDRELQDIKFGAPVVGHVIEITNPDTNKTIRWETDKTLTPLAIGINHGAVYLVARPRFCWVYEQLGRPEPPYVFFKYQEGGWQRISVGELPSEIAKANLLVSPRLPELESQYVDVATTRSSNIGLSDEIRNIYRSGIKGWEFCVDELPKVKY